MKFQLVDREWIRATLKKKGLEPSGPLFSMNHTSALLSHLGKRFPVPDIASFDSWSDSWLAWEVVGLYYLSEGRYYEGLSVFSECYQALLDAQRRFGSRVHKGKPLIWMSDSYWHLGWTHMRNATSCWPTARTFLQMRANRPLTVERTTVLSGDTVLQRSSFAGAPAKLGAA